MIESNNRQEPSYYSILTADVRYCKDMSDSEKILYTEITCLSNRHGYCYATNKYFAELYGTSVRTVQRRLSNLQEHGFIKIIVERNEKQEVISRKIYIKLIQDYSQNHSTNINNSDINADTAPPVNIDMTSHDNIDTSSHDKSVVTPPVKNVAYNNTSMNITSNNNISVLPKVSQSNQSSSFNNTNGHDNDNDSDYIQNTSNIENEIKDKIEYEIALSKRPEDGAILTEILANILTMYQHDLTVEDKLYPRDIVQSILDRLTADHLLELVDKVKNMQYRVTNKKRYIQSMIFNTVLEYEITFSSNLQKMLGYQNDPFSPEDFDYSLKENRQN